jgi:excisionase family DNA binding protein
MLNEYPDILTVEQLQQILKIGRNTAYKLLKTKKIRSIRIGKIHKIPKINIIEYLQNNL